MGHRYTDGARAVFDALVTRLRRREQVHLDPDDTRILGWCVVRLGRYPEASRVLLDLARTGDRAAETLFALVVLSVLEDDRREARVLERRALRAAQDTGAPTQRGILADTLLDLASVERVLTPETRQYAGELGRRLTQERDTPTR